MGMCTATAEKAAKEIDIEGLADLVTTEVLKRQLLEQALCADRELSPMHREWLIAHYESRKNYEHAGKLLERFGDRVRALECYAKDPNCASRAFDLACEVDPRRAFQLYQSFIASWEKEGHHGCETIITLARKMHDSATEQKAFEFGLVRCEEQIRQYPKEPMMYKCAVTFVEMAPRFGKTDAAKRIFDAAVPILEYVDGGYYVGDLYKMAKALGDQERAEVYRSVCRLLRNYDPEKSE